MQAHLPIHVYGTWLDAREFRERIVWTSATIQVATSMRMNEHAVISPTTIGCSSSALDFGIRHKRIFRWDYKMTTLCPFNTENLLSWSLLFCIQFSIRYFIMK